MSDFTASGKMYFMDNIRAFIVFLVIVLHCAVPYLSFVPYKWLVVDSARSVWCDYIVLASEYFVMAVMFFVAGYFAPPSLVKNGPAGFARSRLLRLGIPFVFGMTVLCPVMTYVRDLAKGRDPGNYAVYWFTKYFHGKMYAGYLWFLSTLLVFMLLLYLAYTLSPRLRSYLQSRGSHRATDMMLQPRFLVLLSFCIGLCVFAINLMAPDGFWVRLGQKGIIVFQPTRLPVYAGFFVWGIIACRARWSFICGPGAVAGLKGWAAGALLCLASYVGLVQSYVSVVDTSVLMRLAIALLRALGPLCITMLIIGCFKYRAQHPARWKALVAENSYGMYLAHIPFVVVFQYLLLDKDFPAPAKFAIVALLSLPLSFFCSHFVLRKLPLIGRYF